MKTHFKTFPCSICGETFDKKSNYLRHMQLHQQQLSANGDTSGLNIVNYTDMSDDFTESDLNSYVRNDPI